MREVAFQSLSNLENVVLEDKGVVVNRVNLVAAKKINIEKDEQCGSIHLKILSENNDILATVSIGSHQRLLASENWSYIERK